MVVISQLSAYYFGRAISPQLVGNLVSVASLHWVDSHVVVVSLFHSIRQNRLLTLHQPEVDVDPE